MNGLMQSATKYMQAAIICEFGLEPVITAALYRPLAKRDQDEINDVYNAAHKIYNRIFYVLLGYILILLLVFPKLTKTSYITADTLLVAIAIGTVFEYWIGKAEKNILTADRHIYVISIASITATVTSVAFGLLLIHFKASLVSVKLLGSICVAASMIYLYWHVRSKYGVRLIKHFSGYQIKQQWNGIAQHISYMTINYLDVPLMTLMCSLTEISVYSVYMLVSLTIRRTVQTVATVFQPELGNLYAKQEYIRFKHYYKKLNMICVVSMFFAMISAYFLFPTFIIIYTNGDNVYYNEHFTFLVCLSCFLQSCREPIHKVVQVMGLFKETQNIYWTATVLNIVLSVVGIWYFGFIGVTFGPIASMLVQNLCLRAKVETEIERKFDDN